MSSLHDVRVSYSDSAVTGEDPSLGDALERVFEAQQSLVVRRVDLLLEEITAKAKSLVSLFVGAIVGALAALAGWFIAIAGVIDVLDDRFARSAVEIGMGMLHVGAGIALVLYLLRRRIPEVSSS
jgi:uncharacterized membrane protein YqjE